ncbi:hypothetical protein CTI12_AA477490 [Artemisia annua]|uniref:Uncharacterized protein n=1 Tax=Artemisia annua TaxID=35608 RepID=A0A2U1LL63_ARTAN|nr:hypothetical protein CTI12_AA477490 [Artemisia annua]
MMLENLRKFLSRSTVEITIWEEIAKTPNIDAMISTLSGNCGGDFIESLEIRRFGHGQTVSCCER